MSTIAEIERAIEQLPSSDIGVLAAWLEKYQASLLAPTIGTESAGQDKPFMKFAGSLEGTADLSQRKGFSTK